MFMILIKSMYVNCSFSHFYEPFNIIFELKWHYLEILCIGPLSYFPCNKPIIVMCEKSRMESKIGCKTKSVHSL